MTDRATYRALNGDVPLTGNWNSSGMSEVGLFRPSDGTFYLDHNGKGTLEGCKVHRCFQIGIGGETPLVGKW